MSNYQQTEGQGIKWRRCDRVEINNPLGGTPIIVFHEQDVVSIEGGPPVAARVTNTTIPFAIFNTNGTINLYNPLTLEPTGETVTHAQLYTILFSLYLESATIRDNNFTPTSSVTTTTNDP